MTGWRPRLANASETIFAMSTAPVYQEKYGFPADYARLLFICAAFALAGIVVPLPGWLRLLEFVIFGGAGLALLVLGVRATTLIALKVDETGLTLGGTPLRYTATTQVVPWPELRAVRLSRQSEIPRLPVLTADRRGKREPLNKVIKGWRLDVEKLGEAMLSLAPGVHLTDRR